MDNINIINLKIDKLKEYRDGLTPEQKREAMQRAIQGRADKVAERKANEHLYTLKYLDEGYWQSMAQEAKYKMPNHNQPCTTGEMRKVFKKLKVDVATWLDACALRSLQQWIVLNPKHTAYAFAGNVLEYVQDASQRKEMGV